MELIPQDQEHLRLLSIFHYVAAGLAALFACLPVIHLGVGIAMLTHPQTFAGDHGSPPPPFAGWFFVIFGAVFIAAGWTLAVLLFVAGRFLGRHGTTFSVSSSRD